MVVKQTHRHEPLLKRGVCETHAGIESNDVWTTMVWPYSEIAYVLGDLGAAGTQWLVPLALADGEVISETSCVRFDGSRREAEIGLNP
jgi:hypothetical protein